MSEQVAPQPEKAKKPFYKRWWFIVIIAVVVIMVIASLGSGDDANTDATTETETVATEAREEATEEATEAEPVETDPPTEAVSREFQNAVKACKDYDDFTGMSKQGMIDQLTSEYADQFPLEAAEYAVENCGADWKENALRSAKEYQETMGMSKAAIYDQLVSEHGEQFTEEEAQYAVDNLPE